MAYLASLGYVHRDLKSSCVTVGDGDVCKVAGLGKAVINSSAVSEVKYNID